MSLFTLFLGIDVTDLIIQEPIIENKTLYNVYTGEPYIEKVIVNYNYYISGEPVIKNSETGELTFSNLKFKKSYYGDKYYLGTILHKKENFTWSNSEFSLTIYNESLNLINKLLPNYLNHKEVKFITEIITDVDYY